MSLVSILTPTYNQAPFIERCIESVQQQTHVDWEMIVVDDGSTDGTPEIARSIGDHRVRVLTLPHRGLGMLADTYRAGLEASRGDMVAIVEGDDEWPPDKLERQLGVFTAGIVLSYGWAELIDEASRPFALTRRAPRSTRARNNDPVPRILDSLLLDNFIVSSTVMVKRTALEAIGGFRQPQGSLVVDHPTWLALALAGRFAYIPAVMGRWRRHRAQATQSYTRETADAPHATLLSAPSVSYLYSALAEASPLIPVDRVRALRTQLDRRIGWWQDYIPILRSRLALVEGNWVSARGYATLASSSRHPSIRALGYLCLVGTLLHKDVEGVCRRFGLFTWR